jgi:hypothetical protein
MRMDSASGGEAKAWSIDEQEVRFCTHLTGKPILGFSKRLGRKSRGVLGGFQIRSWDLTDIRECTRRNNCFRAKCSESRAVFNRICASTDSPGMRLCMSAGPYVVAPYSTPPRDGVRGMCGY